MKAKFAFLPGDGIGPEVVEAALLVLKAVEDKFNHNFETPAYPIGGCAIDEYSTPLPEETLGACLEADVVILGAVGGPKWDDPLASVRPEQGLLGLRKALGLFTNIRPVKIHKDLIDASPLKRERLQDVDILIFRELTGGIYFGTPKERRVVNGEIQSVDTMIYTQTEIRRIAHLAFQTARNRKGKITSVDKANVLESSRLWRQVVSEVALDYPEVELEHLLVDAAAMHLLTRPSSFDVLLTTNMFGDILSDEASVLTGSLGNLPSASLGLELNKYGLPRGLFEPIHGSAPDIAGKGIANPIGMILSLGMALHYSLGLENEARRIEKAVDSVILDGFRTADLLLNGRELNSTEEMSNAIVERIYNGGEL